MTGFRPLISALALGGLLALGACSAAQESVRDADGNITESNDNASVFDMKVGDCFTDAGQFSDEEATEVETMPAVPCAEEHDYEVYAVDTLADGDFPGEETLIDRADQFCYEQFEPFVGATYEESSLDFTFLFPTSQTWRMDDREITCLMYDMDGPGTGTLEGARR